MARQTLPTHVGFIMDGNRRWAKQNGKPTFEGHFAAQKVLRDTVYHAVEKGVAYVSVYAFSNENWSRSQEEITYLMEQVAKALAAFSGELVEKGIRTVVLGRRERLSKSVLKSIDEIEQKTADGTLATLAICFNYGGYVEIADSLKAILAEGVDSSDITSELIAQHIYHPEIPPLDLIIRTSGEERLSGFMLWRAAYSEFIFRKEYWPDFTVDALDECLLEYSKRQRRFGG